MRRHPAFRLAALAISAAGVACGSSPPTEPTPQPVPQATPLFPMCGVAPNYLDQEGELFRWEQFPVRVSIDRASMSIAGDRSTTYERGITDGAVVWALATQGIVGTTILGFDLSNPDIVIRLDAADEEEQLVGIKGTFTWQLVPPRRLQRGTIRVLFDAIRELHQVIGAEESSDYIASIVGHEMGHALGVQKHSNDPSDLMHSFRNYGRVPYPWVTQRDRNTMQEAYCR